MSFLEGKTILVVDDEPAIRELFKTEFTFQGCECYEAESGQSALELYKQKTFDAIVSDIRMPNGDGMFFLQKILELGDPTSFLVFITGYSDIPVEEFYERGADLVVQKPFEVDIIVKMIEDSLQAPRAHWRQMVRIITILNVAVKWSEQEEPLYLLTYNMSRRGFFIQSKGKLPDINSSIDFEISVRTHTGDRIFSGQAVVIWVRRESTIERPSGFGVEYIGSDTRVMDELAELVGLDYLFSA
jgi:CheY-like chemotaxis protein